MLPVLQRELNASVAATQWIVESYALMLAALILVGGSLGDRLGRKRIFCAGVVLFALASVWCGLAPNIAQLIVARGVQGVGAALLVPGSLALISASFSKEHRGRAIGTWSGFTAIAAGLGPVAGGWLVETYSWRWIFFINIPLALAVLLIAFRIPESRDEHATRRMDWLGAALATAGLGAVVFGLIESGARQPSMQLMWASIGIGTAILAAFVFAEARLKEPMMPLTLFRSRTFAGANLLTLFLYAALGGLLFFLPFDLIQVQGYTPTEAGAAFLPFVLLMFVLSRWAGGLVHRFGSRLPLVVGPLIAAVGFAMFALPGAEAGSYWTSFFPAIIVMSVGMTTSVAPLTTTVMSALEENRAGIASGINNAVSRAASLLAVAVFGVVMLGVFKSDFAERLRSLPLSSQLREQLHERSADLADMDMPDGLSREMHAVVTKANHESFVAGFRLVAYLAAALALASAITSWLMIAK